MNFNTVHSVRIGQAWLKTVSRALHIQIAAFRPQSLLTEVIEVRPS